jgi:hypothetical protein
MNNIALSDLGTKNTKLTVFIFLIISLCCFNVIYFVSSAANPLIGDDAWYFLDINIRKWISEGFELTDLFVKRGVTDHAQPLNKFLLYINYRFFHLDFRFESLMGLLGLFSIIYFFAFRFYKKLLIDVTPISSIIAFSMAMLIFTSLNATGIYTWSLVTYSFLPLAIAFACAWLTWSFLESQRVYSSLLFLLCSMLVIGDTASIILWVSILGTIILLFPAKDFSFKRKAITWLFASGIIVGSIFLIINWEFLFTNATNEATKTSQLHLTDPNFYLEAIRIIFSSSIIHGIHLTNFNDYSKTAAWIIALPIFYFYVKHFLDLTLKKKNSGDLDFLVTFILVYASVSIAAIMFGRVAEYGIDYLNQPRYVVIYQLIPFALLIKWAFSGDLTQEKRKVGHLTIAIFAFIFLILIQLAVSASAYRSVSWIWRWHIEQVKAISQYVNNPTTPAGNCTPHSSPICGLPVSKRNELLNTLQSRNLNIFNSNFQNQHRLFLNIETIKETQETQ